MKKIAFKIVSILLVATFLFTTGISAFAVENESASASNYEIVSPYEEVNWGVTQEYKGNLHTHSTFSDASENLVDTLLEHYEQGFDFVAMTDHGVTGVAWNKKPYQRLLYSYQHLLGLKQNCLTETVCNFYFCRISKIAFEYMSHNIRSTASGLIRRKSFCKCRI